MFIHEVLMATFGHRCNILQPRLLFSAAHSTCSTQISCKIQSQPSTPRNSNSSTSPKLVALQSKIGPKPTASWHSKWVCPGVNLTACYASMLCHHAISLNFLHLVRVTCWTGVGNVLLSDVSNALGLHWGRFHSEYRAPGRPGSPWHHPFPLLPSSLRHRCLAKHCEGQQGDAETF